LKNLLDLNYADHFCILDKNVIKMIELSEVLRVQGATVRLKINVKKTKSLRLETNEDEEVMLRNQKINQMDSFTCLGSNISKDNGCSEDVKVE